MRFLKMIFKIRFDNDISNFTEYINITDSIIIMKRSSVNKITANLPFVTNPWIFFKIHKNVQNGLIQLFLAENNFLMESFKITTHY